MYDFNAYSLPRIFCANKYARILFFLLILIKYDFVTKFFIVPIWYSEFSNMCLSSTLCCAVLYFTNFHTFYLIMQLYCIIYYTIIYIDNMLHIITYTVWYKCAIYHFYYILLLYFTMQYIIKYTIIFML